MSTTLENIYRDVNSHLLSLGVNEQQIFHYDVVKQINQTISDLRVEFIENGLGHEFVYTEVISSTSKDATEYPFLYTATLSKTLMRGLPIQWTVQQSNFWTVPNELQDTTDSWSKGDLAYKDEYVYEATEDISSINTYDDTFEVEDIRNYYIDNGLTYFTGDIVYYETDDTYWECTSEYVNNQGESPSASGAFDKLYWKRVDYTYNEGTPVPFTELFQNKLFENVDNHHPFSIKEDQFYTRTSVTPITLSYIPEWEQVEDLTAVLDIPDFMVQPVRNRSVQVLGNKLGINIENLSNSDE